MKLWKQQMEFMYGWDDIENCDEDGKTTQYYLTKEDAEKELKAHEDSMADARACNDIYGEPDNYRVVEVDVDLAAIPFIAYLNLVDDLMYKLYGITSNDVGMDAIASSHEAGEPPQECVEWFKDKYNLKESVTLLEAGKILGNVIIAEVKNV